MTRCDQLATEGHHCRNRCKVHHGQYRILYKKYKDAQQIVDDLKQGTGLPSKEQIGCYTDWRAALKKAQWVRKYLEAVRVEKRGREIHEQRFFLKVNDGHRNRFNLLEGEMIRAIDTLDALQKRACELYKDALPAMKDLALSKVEEEWEKESRRSTKELVEFTRNPEVFTQGSFMMPPLIIPISEVGDEDLIDMSLREQKEKMFSILRSLSSLESYIEVVIEEESLESQNTESVKALLEKEFFTHQQFARRIIFYESSLFMKSLEKASLEDFFLSDDLSMEDLARFLDMFLQPMGFLLKSFKDAVLDALAMSHHGTAPSTSGAAQIPLLGSCVFNYTDTTTIPNEVWGFLLKTLRPPAHLESRFVCLCNNFEDLVGFLSFAALGLVPSPSFCQSRPHFDPNDPALSRNHLSLSGIVVADMVSTFMPPQLCRPFPTALRATQRGYAVWAEVQIRSYMFGAMRNERDGFTEAFIRELRARPDLFQVVLRSETAPGRQVEMFGFGCVERRGTTSNTWTSI
ncbi:hypothetical protein JVU11DRAFT_8170 [Chiua virens]|nr:hypothetical protein JVU11DRAFT_8170 [Chiua virens]